MAKKKEAKAKSGGAVKAGDQVRVVGRASWAFGNEGKVISVKGERAVVTFTHKAQPREMRVADLAAI